MSLEFDHNTACQGDSVAACLSRLTTWALYEKGMTCFIMIWNAIAAVRITAALIAVLHLQQHIKVLTWPGLQLLNKSIIVKETMRHRR